MKINEYTKNEVIKRRVIRGAVSVASSILIVCGLVGCGKKSVDENLSGEEVYSDSPNMGVAETIGVNEDSWSEIGHAEFTHANTVGA